MRSCKLGINDYHIENQAKVGPTCASAHNVNRRYVRRRSHFFGYWVLGKICNNPLADPRAPRALSQDALSAPKPPAGKGCDITERGVDLAVAKIEPPMGLYV
jgi:hypothetical protein